MLMPCALVLLALVPLNNTVPRRGIMLRPGGKAVAARKRCVLPALGVGNVVSGIGSSDAVMFAIVVNVTFRRGPPCR